MANLFKTPKPKIDPSIKARENEARDQRMDEESGMLRQRQLAARGAIGRQSLMTGGAAGYSGRGTLGGN